MFRLASNLWQNANFLNVWAGQTLSLLGAQVTTLALQLTAALALGASASEVGVLSAANLLPALIAGPIAGLWADRAPRKPMLIASSIARGALLGLLAIAALTVGVRVEYLWLVAFLVGLLTNVFDVAQASLLPSLVQREQLVDGNSKLEVSRAGSMIVGPGLAGLLMQALSAPVAMLAVALTFLTSALLVARIRAREQILPTDNVGRERQRFWVEVTEGVRVIYGNPVLSAMTTSLALFNFFVGIVGVLYVLFVTRELGVSPAGLGLVYTIGSATFPLGAAVSARVAERLGVGRAIVWGAGLSDVALLILPLVGGPPAVAIGMLIVSRLVASLAGPITSINQLSLRQSITPTDLLGRVNGATLAVSLGALAVGTLLGGMLGDAVGVRSSILIGAVGIQLSFLRLLLSPLRFFRELPLVTAGPTALELPCERDLLS